MDCNTDLRRGMSIVNTRDPTLLFHGTTLSSNQKLLLRVLLCLAHGWINRTRFIERLLPAALYGVPLRSTSYVLTVGQILQHPDFPHLLPGPGNIYRPPQPAEHPTLCYPLPYSPPYPHPDNRAPASFFAARRQRSAIACKHCRKRKVCPWCLHDSKAVLTPHQIRCSGYDSSPEGRCWNCVRFNQHCLFQPVSSRAVFVSASAAYGASGTAANASQDHNAQEGRHSWNERRPPVLYGALGVPHEHSAQAVAPQDEIVSLNPSRPDDDPHSASPHTFQSFHQKSRPCHSLYYLQVEDSGTYSYAGPHDSIFESSVTSRTGRQPPWPQRTSSGERKDNIPPPMSDSARSPRSRHNDGKTILVDEPCSCSSSQGRQCFKMHEKHGSAESLRGIYGTRQQNAQQT